MPSTEGPKGTLSDRHMQDEDEDEDEHTLAFARSLAYLKRRVLAGGTTLEQLNLIAFPICIIMPWSK